jgi:hypothetical protein
MKSAFRSRICRSDDVRIDITDWTEEPDFLRAKWRFSSILRVPWRPVLAAAGSTTHKFDPASGLVRESGLHQQSTCHLPGRCSYVCMIHKRAVLLWPLCWVRHQVPSKPQTEKLCQEL